MKDCRWLRPRLVGQFEFVEWTPTPICVARVLWGCGKIKIKRNPPRRIERPPRLREYSVTEALHGHSGVFLSGRHRPSRSLCETVRRPVDTPPKFALRSVAN